jgi:subtilisin family serine protease
MVGTLARRSTPPRWAIAPGGGAVAGFGTSFAAPQVTGAIALLLQTNPRLTPEQAKAILQATATHAQGMLELAPPRAFSTP